MTMRSRSEEHTSELQSRVDLVCRLLLEKKKRKGVFPGGTKRLRSMTIQSNFVTTDSADARVTNSGLSTRATFLPERFFFFLMIRPPPRSTLFPYTPLFRSCHPGSVRPGRAGTPRRHVGRVGVRGEDRKSTRLNSSHEWISYAVFCLKKK